MSKDCHKEILTYRSNDLEAAYWLTRIALNKVMEDYPGLELEICYETNKNLYKTLGCPLKFREGNDCTDCMVTSDEDTGNLVEIEDRYTGYYVDIKKYEKYKR